MSLLSTFGKIFEKVIFYRIYFLPDETLLNPNESGFFCPSNSCANQLLAKTYEIFKAFDCNPPLEVRSVFLDISKSFHNVQHQCLFYKLKSVDTSWNFIIFLKITSQVDSKEF